MDGGGAGLAAIGFAHPWLLAALIALPVLIWLLRVTPPAPKLLSFPAVRLLLDIPRRDETAARTPWWLLLLRILAAALVIIGLARPVLNAGSGAGGSGPLLIVVDDGWAAGQGWPQRVAAIETALDRAERAGRPVMLLATAPSDRGEPPRVSAAMPAQDMRERVAALRPRPWQPDRATARRAAEQLRGQPGLSVVWVADGLSHGNDDDASQLAASLAALGPLTVIAPPAGATPRTLGAPVSEPGRIVARVASLPVPAEVEVAVLARTADGRTLARATAMMPAGATTAEVPLTLPPELRNRLTSLVIENGATAGSVALLDERWRRRPVGLIAGNAETADQPLLGELYYLDRALSPFTELRRGTVRELLARDIAVIVLSDVDTLTEPERDLLARWVNDGGVLVRFAGPRLAARPDQLLPVTLRAGDRQLGGALSWQQPAALAAFPEGSPFFGLTVPAEVRVTRQVLAEPSIVLANRTWARLADGTPLVTGEQRGRGTMVLFHITANTEWSSLPLSGLFLEMLQRLVQLSTGIGTGAGEAVLAPYESLDGFGRLSPPPPFAAGLSAAAIGREAPSPRHPPGFYGPEAARVALNLGPAAGALRPFGAMPAGVETRMLDQEATERDLRPLLLGLALVLVLVDLMLSLVLRGLVRPLPASSGPAAARGAAVALLLLAAAPSVAQTAPVQAAIETRLAYVVTGAGAADDVSRAGLAGLTDFVNRRTAANLGEPMGVRPGQDELSFYPLIYWPMTTEQAGLDAAGIAALNDFMRQGGILMLDTRDAGSGQGMNAGGDAQLRRLTRGLSIPALAPVPADHVLARAFYLLTDFPGRWVGGQVWVQRDQDRANDSVSPVIIGGHDWAAAWAVDAQGRNPYATVPGGARQRLLAYRFGVNLVMYALTGNYKGDQVHVPVLLERLGQ
ncbi:DUF4159 domain-containing protein [Elioraea sp.]|uniref:DUF4159 domain-containing protein n=1 Tax=Elioraea sp. TaxID=2185103 RepID=UPI0025C39ADE|nr:DUF4159 domain-containing protein [Elioraea sp.]